MIGEFVKLKSTLIDGLSMEFAKNIADMCFMQGGCDELQESYRKHDELIDLLIFQISRSADF
jgi:hypothetical protein